MKTWMATNDLKLIMEIMTEDLGNLDQHYKMISLEVCNYKTQLTKFKTLTPDNVKHNFVQYKRQWVSNNLVLFVVKDVPKLNTTLSLHHQINNVHSIKSIHGRNANDNEKLLYVNLFIVRGASVRGACYTGIV